MKTLIKIVKERTLKKSVSSAWENDIVNILMLLLCLGYSTPPPHPPPPRLTEVSWIAIELNFVNQTHYLRIHHAL